MGQKVGSDYAAIHNYPVCASLGCTRRAYPPKAYCHECDTRLETIPAPPPIPDDFDAVNCPPHYLAHPSGVECIAVTEEFNFNLGNAIKYIWRADLKGNQLKDLKKARWYLDREISRLEKAGE